MAHCHRASVAGDPPRDRPPPPTRGNGGQACALSARGPLALARLLGRAPGIRRPCAPRDPAVRDSPSRTTYRRTGVRGIRLGMAAVGLSVLASGAPGAGIPIYHTPRWARPPNLAARMEQMATPGSVLLTADALRLAEGLRRGHAARPRQRQGAARAGRGLRAPGRGVVPYPVRSLPGARALRVRRARP